jgi:hypothetical protein
VMAMTERPLCSASAHRTQSHPKYITPSHNPRTTSRYTCTLIVHNTLHLPPNIVHNTRKRNLSRGLAAGTV